LLRSLAGIFNPQIASSGPSFVASSQVLYNRLITFDPVKNTPIPSLATEWTSRRMAKPGPLPCVKA
jgi:ABC-type transport system substrate-binding protein